MPVTRVRVTSQNNCNDVTIVKSEKTVLKDYGEIGNRYLFLAELCVQGHKMACKK